jgi:hypothetical protein
LPVDLPIEPDDNAALWRELLDLADVMPVPWVLIGAQMVVLHVRNADGQEPRASRDGDVLVNVRQTPAGTRILAEHLGERGFEMQGPSRQGLGHEFRREGVAIDILAPDNLGVRARLETLNSARTVSVPGGTQALSRAERIDVRIDQRTGSIPVPNLLGAIILKFEAIAIDDVPDAQRADVAALLSLVSDVESLIDDLKPAERRLLQRYPEFGDAENPLYSDIARAREAAATYRQLAIVND